MVSKFNQWYILNVFRVVFVYRFIVIVIYIYYHVYPPSEKIATLERDHKSLRRSGEKWRQASIRVREHEKEASDLHQKTQMDKKTITTLREELVQEKIKSQQITNELDQLKAELHKMGLDKEKLEADATAADEQLVFLLIMIMSLKYELCVY